MAVVVIGALLSSTVLTLFVVPALYTLMDDAQQKLIRRPRPVAPVPEPTVPVHVVELGNRYVLRAALPGGNGHGDWHVEVHLPKGSPIVVEEVAIVHADGAVHAPD
jgi:hypothetical protein